MTKKEKKLTIGLMKAFMNKFGPFDYYEIYDHKDKFYQTQQQYLQAIARFTKKQLKKEQQHILYCRKTRRQEEIKRNGIEQYYTHWYVLGF